MIKLQLLHIHGNNFWSFIWEENGEIITRHGIYVDLVGALGDFFASEFDDNTVFALDGGGVDAGVCQVTVIVKVYFALQFRQIYCCHQCSSSWRFGWLLYLTLMKSIYTIVLHNSLNLITYWFSLSFRVQYDNFYFTPSCAESLYDESGGRIHTVTPWFDTCTNNRRNEHFHHIFEFWDHLGIAGQSKQGVTIPSLVQNCTP